MELATLKTRLMEASGPSRELDAAIMVATSGEQKRTLPGESEPPFHCGPGTFWVHGNAGQYLHEAPHLTASVDAALELVSRKLPGKSWRLGQFKNPKGEVECWAALDGVAVSYKSSLPIAILTALVTALIDGEEE